MDVNDNYFLDEHNADDGPLAETCCGEDCRGGCGCTCEMCMGESNISLDDENSESYKGEGGSEHATRSDPIKILGALLDALDLPDSSDDEDHIGLDNNSYEATEPLTMENVKHINKHFNDQGYHEKWLQRHRMEVDEDPFPYFIDRVEDPRYDTAGMIDAERLEDSMHVDTPVSAKAYSMLSGWAASLSHSSHSAGAVLRGVGFIDGQSRFLDGKGPLMVL